MIRLGKGGMGEAWLAIRAGEAEFRRWVVVKRIRLITPTSSRSTICSAPAMGGRS
jgi:hypothetical protein